MLSKWERKSRSSTTGWTFGTLRILRCPCLRAVPPVDWRKKTSDGTYAVRYSCAVCVLDRMSVKPMPCETRLAC
jgi:hypothetical protein